MFNDVKAFREKFNLTYSGPPRNIPYAMRDDRFNHMMEELYEYYNARTKADQLDALVDLVYVALGTAALHGFPFDEAWARVHAANMKKMRAASAKDSKRNDPYDVVKPPGWVPPDLTDLV